MRRALLTFSLVGALLASGCGEGSSAGTATPAATAASSGQGAPGGADGQVLCDQVKRVSADSGRAVTDAGAELLVAQAQGDKAAIAAAEKKIDAALRDWAAKLSTQAANAKDPKVRQDVANLAAAIKKVADDDQPTIQSLYDLREKASKIC